MNRHERWVLEVACELKQPLRALTSANLPAWFNRPHHGLDPSGVAQVLRKLLREGLIVLARRGEGVLDSEEELRRLVEGGHDGPLQESTYYGLTASGGAAWEEVACPDWNRFIDVSFGVDPDEGEVVCADPARLEGFVFSPYQDNPPIPDSMRRDRLEPWQATYWKILPLGHRIRFAYDPGERAGPEHGRDAWHRSRAAWLEDVNRWFAPDGS